MRLKGHKVEGPRSLSSPAAAAAQLLTLWMSVNDSDRPYLEIPEYVKHLKTKNPRREMTVQ